jgi:hypothetical protein
MTETGTTIDPDLLARRAKIERAGTGFDGANLYGDAQLL